MRMNVRLLSFAAALALPVIAVASSKDYVLSSPDRNLSVSVSTGDGIRYSVSRNGSELLCPSEISMTLLDGTEYGGKARVLRHSVKNVDQTIKTVAYKKAEVRDNYNQLTLEFKAFRLLFRAYDEGFAYRFVSKSSTPFIVKSEKASFVFADDYQAYVPYVRTEERDFEAQYMNSFENTYVHIPLSGWDSKRLAFLPVTVEAQDEVKLCVTEADLLDYPGMFLSNPDGGKTLAGVFAPYPKTVEQGGYHNLEGIVTSREDYLAKCSANEEFPWRIVMAAPQAKDLMNEDLVYKLSSPAEGTAEDWSWVRPGKAAWEWWHDWNIGGVDFKAGINTPTYKYYLDFAGEYGLEYMLVDEGWTEIGTADLLRVIPEFDLEEIVNYASGKNTGLILWAGYWALNKDIDGLCEHYSKLGVKGLKVDFTDRDDQVMVNFLRDVAAAAARHHLVLDFHGSFKPTGLQRTYPNILNIEGVAGQENLKWSADVDQVNYDLTIPFVRMAAGAMDYNNGAMKNASKWSFRPNTFEPMSQGTRCHQIAEYVVFDEPLAMLSDSPENYRKEPECVKFISEIPTSWLQTIALDGKIEDYAALAKQALDGSWYIGALNNWDPRDLVIDLSFLDDRSYEMICFEDGINADKKGTDYKMVTRTVPDDRKLTIHLASGGGWAARLVTR